jgi:predicted transcriptional regulator
MFGTNQTMKNRSRYEVIAAILKSAGRDETRTKIMYKAMLSNDQCKLYLDSLLGSGLIEGSSSGNKVVYRITQKGNKFLSYYDQMRLLLPVVVEESHEGSLYHPSAQTD